MLKRLMATFSQDPLAVSEAVLAVDETLIGATVHVGVAVWKAVLAAPLSNDLASTAARLLDVAAATRAAEELGVADLGGNHEQQQPSFSRQAVFGAPTPGASFGVFRAPTPVEVEEQVAAREKRKLRKAHLDARKRRGEVGAGTPVREMQQEEAEERDEAHHQQQEHH